MGADPRRARRVTPALAPSRAAPPSGGARARKRDAFLSAIAEAPALMGVLKVTPPSLSSGGERRRQTLAAVDRAKAMSAAGAAIVDVGGDPPAPGHAEEELRQIAPALEALSGRIDVPVSISTGKAAVARGAVRLGAAVVNDAWGLQRDSDMADAVAETGAGLIIMHNRADVDGSIDIIAEVERFFERSLALAARAGVAWSRILLDPGVGFGKTPEQSYACIWNLDRLRRFGRPILIGLSRKSSPPRIAGRAPDERLFGPLATAAVALTRGAAVLAVDDVRRHKIALDAFNQLRLAAAPAPRVEDSAAASVILSLGGNIGDSAAVLRRALHALGRRAGN